VAIYSYLISFLTSLFLSFVLTRKIRNYAIQFGWLDPPNRGRHAHTNPVPRLGGVAIVLACTGAIAISLLLPRLMGGSSGFSARMVLAILFPGLVVFLMGLYDDLHPLGPYWKFGVQGLATVLLYMNGVGVHRLGFVSHGQVLGIAIGLPLTILWVLLITNSFNLLDGLDGLAAGSALFSTIIIFAISLLRQNSLVSFLTIALAGAILGFLRYNFNPASIFLGDSGSLFIGFMLSALALTGSQKATTMVAVAIPVVSFGLPIADVTLSVIRRLLRGRPLFSGDDDHIHHKLLKRGLSHRHAVLILYAVTAGFGLLSLVLLHGDAMIAFVLSVVGLGVWLGVQQLQYAEFAELHALFQKTGQRRRIIVNNLQIRRATELLSTCAEFEHICQTLKDALESLGFDGFLISGPYLDDLPQPSFAPFRRTPDGRLRYDWGGYRSDQPEWELSFDLLTSSGYRWGQFSVFRECFEEPLLVDINLLSGEFRRRLTDAAHRAALHAQAAVRDLGAKEAHLISRAASAN
jgi:UDP-GlcNAc:undecaprenyl-phosphate/decaprenyl-phosphate GlcNAc-1-phosphate transferase